MDRSSFRARRRLSDQLRQLRGDQPGRLLAQRLGWGQPKVSKLETGRQLPTEQDVRDWAGATGGDAASLLDLLSQAEAEYLAVRKMYDVAGGPARLQDAIAVRESSSKTLVRFQPAMIVGLLQTADYAREVLRLPDAFGDDVPDDDLSRAVAARIRRQAILLEPDRSITLLMGEAALWTRVTSMDLHLAQLEHLARTIRGTRAVVGILPFEGQMPISAMSGFSILDDAVTIETLGGDLNIGDPVEVGEYDTYVRLLLEAARTGPAAVELIQSVAEQLRARHS